MKIKSIQPAGSPDERVESRRLIPMVLLAALLLAVASVPWVASAHADDDDGAGEFVPRQVVVKLKPGVKIGAINEKYRTKTIERLLGSKGIYLLRTPRGKNPATLAERMQNDQRIIYAEPNFKTASPEGDFRHRARPGGEPSAPSSDSGPYSDQYAIGALNLADAHNVTGGGGSVVAVIDTGVQLDHPELRDGLTEARYDFIADDRVPADGANGLDDDGDGEADELTGHGTHVAGIVKLAAPETRIMPLRALNSDGWGNIFVLAEAINYAARNSADVVNLSLSSSGQSELLEDLIGDDDDDDSDGQDMVFVAAAGNDNDSLPQYPAAEEGAIAVTSVDQEKKKSDFANYGPWVTIAAPGTDIYSLFPTGQYAMWSGTSMATPFVASQAALIRSLQPPASSRCVTTIIRTTAQSLTTSDPTYASQLGSGHADVGASTQYAANPSNPCPAGGDD
jgi:subtilisin family serine protease